MRVAPSFPQTIFLVTSSAIAGENYAGMRFAFEEPAYLAGVVAGAITRSNVIGQIGGMELPVRGECRFSVDDSVMGRAQ